VGKRCDRLAIDARVAGEGPRLCLSALNHRHPIAEPSSGAAPTIGDVSDAVPHIGTLREKPLHASLKRWYARDGDRVEVPIDGFVVDLVRDDLLIEVQTRGFSSMKQKVTTLLDRGHRIRIVHPIPTDKWIVKLDVDGTTLGRRRSPRHGDPTDLFAELVSFPDLFVHPNLEIEVLLTREEEYRCHSPDRAWRRKGWTVVERRLLEVVESVALRNAKDLAGLLPANLPVTFTTADLAMELGRPRRIAQQMAYCLRNVGAIVAVGKRGNAVEYQVA
jgi:hypothetical protein